MPHPTPLAQPEAPPALRLVTLAFFLTPADPTAFLRALEARGAVVSG